MKPKRNIFSLHAAKQTQQTRVHSQPINSHSKNDILKRTLTELPSSVVDLGKAFMSFTPDEIHDFVEENSITEAPAMKTHYHLHSQRHFDKVLVELEKLKDKLGGSPTFLKKTPTLHDPDANRTFFGMPMPAVKDWFRMTLKKEWPPKAFWTAVSKRFGVTKNAMSQYEEAHLRIQRFGILISNKEKFNKILDNKDEKKYNDLPRITGIAWHPSKNGAGTEKLYIEFVEHFLTAHFDEAKKNGEKALIEYFKAFEGVCFEDRARYLEDYAKNHPIANSAAAELKSISDWDSNTKAEDVFMKETVLLAEKIHAAPTEKQLFDHLKNKGVFDLAFMTDKGVKEKPSLNKFKEWATEQVENCILEEAAVESASSRLKL